MRAIGNLQLDGGTVVYVCSRRKKNNMSAQPFLFHIFYFSERLKLRRVGARCTSGLNMGSLSQVLRKQSATPLPTVRRRRRIGPCARRARALPPSMPASEDKDTGKLRTAMEDEAPARRSPRAARRVRSPSQHGVRLSHVAAEPRPRAPLFCETWAQPL